MYCSVYVCKDNAVFDLIGGNDRHCDVRDNIVWTCLVIVKLISIRDARSCVIIIIINHCLVVIVVMTVASLVFIVVMTLTLIVVIVIIPCIVVIVIMTLVLLFFLYDLERKKNCCKQGNND